MAGARKPPWYRQTEILDRACAYMRGYLALWEADVEPPQVAQVESHRFDALADLIFESNTFESAGMSATGTREVLTEIGVEPLARPVRAGLVVRPFKDLFDVRGGAEAALRHRGRTREVREVTQHFVAWWELWNAATQHGALLRGIDEAEIDRQAKEQVSAETGVPIERLGAFVPAPFFLSADFLREVHRSLASGLLPEGSKVAAGDFRIDHRIAGRATGFVAPSLIESAMSELERDATRLFDRPMTAATSEVYELAARFSHRITAIHPFPDFNGRLSRLVLSAVMQWGGLPFPVSIKFDKKGRERYLYALRRADKGDLRPMTTLVARAVVDGFEDIDAKLVLAGLPPLLPASRTT